MKNLKQKYHESLIKYAEANHKILVEKKLEGAEYKHWSRIEKTNGKKAYEFYLKIEELNQLDELIDYLYSNDVFIKTYTAGLLVAIFPEITKPVLQELLKSDIPSISLVAMANLREVFGMPIESHR